MITNSHTTSERTTAHHERREGTMTRLGAIVAVAGISIGALGSMGSSVSADRPVEFEDSFTFSDVNPCTETPMEVTIDSVVRLTEHGDRFVAHVSRTGSTDDGYVMDHGVESAVFNGEVFRQALTDTFRNADGSKFQARGVVVETDGSIRVERFTLSCLDR
jgi:hypothetical protein